MSVISDLDGEVRGYCCPGAICWDGSFSSASDVRFTMASKMARKRGLSTGRAGFDLRVRTAERRSAWDR